MAAIRSFVLAIQTYFADLCSACAFDSSSALMPKGTMVATIAKTSSITGKANAAANTLPSNGARKTRLVLLSYVRKHQKTGNIGI